MKKLIMIVMIFALVAVPCAFATPTVSSVWPTEVYVDLTTNFFTNASDVLNISTCNFQWETEPIIDMDFYSGEYYNGTCS